MLPRGCGLRCDPPPGTRSRYDAPCSVLIAREVRDAGTWPQAVVLGVDGSAESAAAFAAARSIAKRFGASHRAVASMRDQVDREAARAIAPELEEQSGRAVKLLVAASDSADLVLVGSRGLHGLKALGSVSERVAHEARSSVARRSSRRMRNGRGATSTRWVRRRRREMSVATAVEWGRP